MKQTISELESLLIKTQDELLNKNKEADQFKEDVEYQKKRRDSISNKHSSELQHLEKICHNEEIKFNLCFDSNEKLQYELEKSKHNIQKVKITL